MSMSTDEIKVGDMVRCGVYVLGEWRQSYLGRIVQQSSDGAVSHVDVMSHHGGSPWIHFEQTSHLRKMESVEV
jgi:hypothetical protein